MVTGNKIEIPEIVHLLSGKMDYLVVALGLQGRYENNDFVAYNPTRNDTHLGSFRICVKGAKCGTWKEFAGGDAGGDALELINYCLFGNRQNKAEAIKWAKVFLGIDNSLKPGELKMIKQEAREYKAKAAEADKERREKSKKMAERIFLSAEPSIAGTPVEDYLLNRGIDLRELGKHPKALRYAPKCWFSLEEPEVPAMVACVNAPDGSFMAVHRTFLQNDKGLWVKRKKRVLGDCAGGVIRLWRGDTNASISRLEAGTVKETENSGVLIISEGIENGLSVAVACPEYRVWASISSSNMANVKIPKCIETVIIAADNDEPDSPADRGIMKAAEEFERQGCTVKIAYSPNGKDFNDQLKA